MKYRISEETRTLEQLENSFWGAPEYQSSLVVNCHKYRKIPLREVTIEQVRLLLSQNIGTKFLMPLALKILKDDVLAEASYYPGDLLAVVLRLDPAYRQANFELHQQVLAVLQDNLDVLMDIENEVDKSLLEAVRLYLS